MSIESTSETQYTDLETAESDNQIGALFHKLWGKAKDKDEYIKAEWRELRKMIEARGINI